MATLPANLLARMLEVQQAIVAETSAERVMHVVTDAAMEFRGASGAVVELADGEDMVYRAVAGSAEPHAGLRLKVAGSFSGLCVRTGQTLVCDDTETDDRVDREATRAVGVRSMIVAPLRRGQHTIGAFKLLSDRPRAFRERDAQVIELMAGFIAHALHNATAYERAQREALHDPLTGLANRTLFHDRLEHALSRVRRQRAGAVAVLYLDLDGFKPVNDRHGHEAGDALLQQVARRLRRVARDTDTVARLGGDEFAVLATELASPEDVSRVVERVRRAIEAEPYVLTHGEAFVGASVGAAVAAGGEAGSADKLMRDADAAMYAEKRGRRVQSA